MIAATQIKSNISLVLELEGLANQEQLFDKLFNEQFKISVGWIIQEAIHNALKHSKASKIEVSLELSELTSTTSEYGQRGSYLFELAISDNGVGVTTEQLAELNTIDLTAPARFSEVPHFGTKMITEQVSDYAQLYNSQLQFFSNEGFEVLAVFYLPASESEDLYNEDSLDVPISTETTQPNYVMSEIVLVGQE